MTATTPLRVLVVHNRYRERGGEDAVVDDEQRLLAMRGHVVFRHERHNDEIALQPAWRTAAESVWSRRSLQELRALVDSARPDVIHVHNTWALLSPSVLWAAEGHAIGVVATLHNHRLACLEGTFQRDGAVCRACLGQVPWRGVVAGCYRGSRVQSAVLAASIVVHRRLGSWTQPVHRCLVLNEGARATFEAIGLPRERLRVRPNFAWPVPEAAVPLPRHGGVYVGRLSPEKGAGVMAEVLALRPDLPLTVLGDGPHRATLAAAGATCLGALAPAEVPAHLLKAAWCVIPSVTLEQFPRVLAEAYAAGLPVIASRLGPLAEWVRDGETGLLVEPGQPQALADAMAWAEAHPHEMAAMGAAARRLHAEHLGPDAAARSLEAVYREAIDEARGGSP
ncbi:MAG: glycosyltransferase family 4 protein [Rubrivivax sp.]|jgi:glycosyltransferase involved in cell wall biosynthesis|nr:glycosyltransferase family 4 protein [Rubrivivax sp.]